MESRFKVVFFPVAFRELQALDGSVREMVFKKIEALKYRADEIGEECRNTKYANLAGCRRIKFRDAGIRVVYRITDQRVDVLQVVHIIMIGKRADEEVYKQSYVRIMDQAKYPSDSDEKKPSR
jgi:mRNA interferase RelE/StbE